jgi:phosphoglycolate phosphatase
MRLKSGPRLAVFDIDGTLVDSREVIHGAALAAFAALSLTPPSYDQVRHIVGLNLDVALAMIAPDLSPAGLVELESHYKAAFHDFHRQPGFIEPLYAGAADTLEHLRQAGWRLSMATGKSRRGVEMVMAMHGWQDLFETTHCADDGPGKPHPAMILAAMKAQGIGPEHTVMIGDTSHDMIMAKGAGVRAQGVSWGFHTLDEVAAHADHVAQDFSDLKTQLLGLAAPIDLVNP